MRRRLLNLLTALSLLLCVAVVTMWVRSYFRENALPVRFRGQACQLVSSRGRVALDNHPAIDAALLRRVDYLHNLNRLREAEAARTVAEATAGAHQRLMDRSEGREVEPRLADEREQAARQVVARVRTAAGSSPPNPPRMFSRSVPYAPVAAVFAVPPVLWSVTGPLRARRRRGRNLCTNCGYDLRATPGRCPECGREPSPVCDLSEA